MVFQVNYSVQPYLFRQISLAPPRKEGRQRQHSKEFLQHLSIAYGPLAEVETHIQIAGRLNYVGESQMNRLIDTTSEIGRMLNGLRKSIEKRI